MTGADVVGADGARGGWAVATVSLGRDGSPYDVRWSMVAHLADVLAGPAFAIGVDMPIGLPERGRRTCDLLAKERLGRAHARVFLTPPRAVLETGTHREASALHRTLVDGAGMSVQTWHLLPKVAEVDDLADDPRLVEVHPELSFAALAGLPPRSALPSKRTPEGRAARIDVLRRWLPFLAADEVPAGDDFPDALAVAWSATRWLAGRADVLPDLPPYDERGRPMRIVV